MSQIREPNHHPHCLFKSWKFSYSSSTTTESNLLSSSMKLALSISLLVSTSFILFSAFSTHSKWHHCPVCDIGTSSTITQNQKISIKKDETNISHILFGIGGSAKTWKWRKHYTELWWKPNVTRGFVWLDEKPNGTWPETSPLYQVSEDTSRFKFKCSYGSRSAIRIARIVLESYRLGIKNVRWFVMGDDDTVFFTDNLVSVLRKYDHNEMYYIGGNSESVEQDLGHSYRMAYGGGGFAISYRLVVELVKLLDGCIDRYANLYGSDQRVGACMDEIGVPLTKEVGFHQIDLKVDPYGFLAAHPMAPLVTLHHLGYVKPLIPTTNQTDSLQRITTAYKTDPGRILQQSLCYDLDRNLSISVAWGYTIQIYPSLLTAKELVTPLQTFTTWKTKSNGPFTFNTRPLKQDPCERPVLYFLDRVEEFGKDNRITFYNKYVHEDAKECTRPGHVAAGAAKMVKVFSTKMDENEWILAPRRQCCEIIKHNSSSDGVLKLRIRKCKTRETFTLP